MRMRLALYSSLSPKRAPPRVVYCAAYLRRGVDAQSTSAYLIAVQTVSVSTVMRVRRSCDRQCEKKRAGKHDVKCFPGSYIRSTHACPSKNTRLLFAWIHGSLWPHSALMSTVTTGASQVL